MKTSIQTLSIVAIAALVLTGGEASAKSQKTKGKSKPTPEEIFKKIDSNSDNAVSLEEFKATKKGSKDPAKAEQVFKKLDSDSNGSLSLDEFKAGAKAMHDKGKHKSK